VLGVNINGKKEILASIPRKMKEQNSGFMYLLILIIEVLKIF